MNKKTNQKILYGIVIFLLLGVCLVTSIKIINKNINEILVVNIIELSLSFLAMLVFICLFFNNTNKEETKQSIVLEEENNTDVKQQEKLDYTKYDQVVKVAKNLPENEYVNFYLITKELLKNPLTCNTQDELDKLTSDLEYTITNLEYKGADYCRYCAAIQKARKYNKYQYENYEMLEKELDVDVSGKTYKDQKDIDIQTENIENAISRLEIRKEPLPTTRNEVETIKEKNNNECQINTSEAIVNVSSIPSINKEINDNKKKEEELEFAGILKSDWPVEVEFKLDLTIRLKMASDRIKKYFSDLKNVLLNYEGVNSKINDMGEVYYLDNKKILSIDVFQTKLRANLPLDVASKDANVYHQTDGSGLKKFEDMPFEIQMEKDEDYNNVVSLTLELLNNCKKRKGFKATNYISLFKTTSVELMRIQGLEFLLRTSCNKEHSEILSDRSAKNATMLETRKPITGELVKTNITIGELSAAFRPNAVIDLDVLKAAKLVSKDSNYLIIKSLGRCTKPITIKADEFESEALKMLILTSGNAIRMID